MDDRELLARLRGPEGGAQEAFDVLFRRCYERLVRSTTVLVRDQAVAEELVQDVMLELWRRRAELAPDTTLIAYLHRSARNRALNHLRHLQVRQRSAPYLADATSTTNPAPAALDAEALESAVADAVASLPPRCREVFTLSRVQGLKYGQIAEQLGVSVKAVEAQMGRALRTMRERLAPWLPAGDGL